MEIWVRESGELCLTCTVGGGEKRQQLCAGTKSSGVFIRRMQMVTACNNVICTTLYCVSLRGSFSW